MTDPRLPARVRRLFRLASRSDDAARADADDELASFLEARSDDLVARGRTCSPFPSIATSGAARAPCRGSSPRAPQGDWTCA